jgi:hypothetical protein
MVATGCVVDMLAHASTGSDTTWLTYSYRDIFGSCKQPVDNNADERCIEPILHRKIRQLGVSHTLGHHNSPNRYS